MIKNVDIRPDKLVILMSAVSATATYALVVLGATVRVTDSGMGCPDWPLCDGHIGPLGNTHAQLEQSHRYLVALVTLLVLISAALAWRRTRLPSVIKLFTAAVITLVMQALLGAVTVWTGNAPATVGLHLAVGLILLGLLVAAAVRAYSAGSNEGEPSLLLRTAVVAVFAVVVSGAVLANTHAEEACRSWPFCVNTDAPGHVVVIQLIHRGIVGAVAILLASAGIWWWRHRTSRWLTVVLLATLGAQVAVGALTAVKGTAIAEDVHVALAAAIWCVVVAMATRDRRHFPITVSAPRIPATTAAE